MSADTRKSAMAIEPPPRPWPFLSPLVGKQEEPEGQDDSTFCECGEIPTIEEDDWNQCMSCGKPIK